MTASSSFSSLPVPEDAMEAAITLHRHREDTTEADVRAIAAPVVAAWAREFAAQLNRATQQAYADHAPSDGEAAWASGMDDAAQMAERFANELDGGDSR